MGQGELGCRKRRISVLRLLTLLVVPAPTVFGQTPPSLGYDLKTVPYVLQFNKRDLPTALPLDEMYRQLNFKGEPTFEAVAMNGTGVFDTLKAVAKLVLTELKKK